MSDTAPYRVLARKYRPSTFAELVGQEAMVRTLTNAFEQGRIAHAFILTGVRGVGKTTTARIIARALNCVGADGKGGPTINPCGVCENCLRIAGDRHVDVLEMDAASRTGIEDIREIIESVRYAPAMARFKVYIIDEVHMLSTAAFNGLLKTLEEPPPHVKFIFATTEIRKVPVTVLSRCQRFDLRRIEPEVMISYLDQVAKREDTSIEGDALALLARAAEGSMRDGLSLLDQAIAHGAGQVTSTAVRDMLGLADRAQVFDLFELIMKGEPKAALENLNRQYDIGADPSVVLHDLLELTHWLTRIKVAPEAVDEPTIAQSERERARSFATRLSLPVLSRAWQLLLKGIAEVRDAPKPILAAEMALIRLIYLAELPPPGDLIRQIQITAKDKPAGNSVPPAATPPIGGSQIRSSVSAVQTSAATRTRPRIETPEPDLATSATPVKAIKDFAELVALMDDLKLKAALVNDVHLVRFEQGRLEFRPRPGAPASLAADLSRKLAEWTGLRWIVSISREEGQPTLRTQNMDAAAERRAAIESHPMVQAVLEAFPGATIRQVRNLHAPEPMNMPAPEPGDEGPISEDEYGAPAMDEGEFEV